MNYTIAVCITTFLRDNLFCKTLQTIADNFPDDCILLIADQGYTGAEKNITIDYLASQIPLEYYSVPFDSGLGYTRNFLVNIANEKHIPYVLISTDSIQFIESYNFKPLFKDLDNKIIVNFKLEDIEAIALSDIFLAKTDTLLNLWDSEMKLYEYSLALLEIVKRGCKIEWNDNYNFKKIKSRNSKEYCTYSKRITEYKKRADQKAKQLCG